MANEGGRGGACLWLAVLWVYEEEDEEEGAK